MDDQGDGTGMRLFFHRERISDRGLEPCFRRPRTTVGRGYAPDNRTAQRQQHALRPWPEALPFKGRFGRMGFPTAAANRALSGDRKSVGEGKGVSVLVDLGGGRIVKK